MQRQRKKTAVLIASSVLFLAGCRDTVSGELVTADRNLYNKLEYESAIVQKGDMQPEFEISLNQEAMVYYNYVVEGENLELEKVNISVGDYVKKGQELVVFKSEELEKKVEKLEEEVEKNRLLLEHVKKQKAINVDENNTTDEMNNSLRKSYDEQIKLLQDDINLSQIYLDEGRQALEKCRIKAKDDGTISFISNSLLNGVVVNNSEIVTEVCGDVRFNAEVKEDYEFKVGDVFHAESPKSEGDVVVTNVEDNDGRSVTVYFEPAGDDVSFFTGEKFIINIKKENLHNVVFVDKGALCTNKDGQQYVYILEEDGFRRVQFVKVSTITNGMAVISEGLEGGEEVTVDD